MKKGNFVKENFVEDVSKMVKDVSKDVVDGSVGVTGLTGFTGLANSDGSLLHNVTTGLVQ